MGKNRIWSGCGTALVTPFNDEGSVDYEVYENTVRRQVDADIDFLVPLGTTAETPNLSDEEKINILKITKANCGGKPVLCGAGSNSTEATIKNIRMLAPYGAEAFLVVVPYYNKPTQQGMYEHFKAVLEATGKPLVIYNVPGRTGANMTAETTLKLAELPGIVAVKEASGNYAQISAVIRDAPEGFSVLSGNDDETLSLMATGADGVISVASNIAPPLMSQLVRALAYDDMVAARRIHYSLMPLFKNCFIESNPIPVKAGMALLGLLRNNLRLPLTRASENTVEIMRRTLKDLGLWKN